MKSSGVRGRGVTEFLSAESVVETREGAGLFEGLVVGDIEVGADEVALVLEDLVDLVELIGRTGELALEADIFDNEVFCVEGESAVVLVVASGEMVVLVGGRVGGGEERGRGSLLYLSVEVVNPHQRLLGRARGVRHRGLWLEEDQIVIHLLDFVAQLVVLASVLLLSLFFALLLSLLCALHHHRHPRALLWLLTSPLNDIV